jgi:uncharacterized membrane protein YccC
MKFSSLISRPVTRLALAFWHITSPIHRYRHAKALHGVRVSLAMAASILLTSGINIPHGDWASVSMLVVIGGLQHHGNIRRKAFERAIGTMVGAAIGMLVIIQNDLIGSLPFTYAVMAICTGVAGYYAIGKAGYIALLTGITVCIVAGHGDNSMEIGLWRSLNVMIGIGIALAFSFAFPLHAVYSWRFELAKNLRRSVRVYQRLLTRKPFSAQEQSAIFSDLGGRLVRLRGLMPSVAKELNASMAQLDAIQREHRAILSALELIASSSLGKLEAERRVVATRYFGREGRQMCRMLLRTARALRTGDAAWLQVPAATPALPAPQEMPDHSHLPADMQGPYWVLQQLAVQADRMRVLIGALPVRRGENGAEGERAQAHPAASR